MPNLDIQALNDLNISKDAQLKMHLQSNFYPHLPEFVIKTFINAFIQYWNYDIDIKELENELSSVYKGSLSDYGFYNFLNDDDLIEEVK